MEQYIYPILIGGAELIILLILLILILRNKKVQETLGKFFVFLGKANSEKEGFPSSVRLNQFYASTILNACIGFVFIWVAVTPSLSSFILVYLTAVIGYLLTLAGFKNWGKSIEVGKEVDLEKAENANG